MNKDVRKMVKALKREGLTVKPSRSQHLNIYQGDRRVATMPVSPSDYRWSKNLMADIRRTTGIDLRR
ncbi:hypothetical protein K0U83_16755 [bacterium]|nr:hypothetical protein [bacterium]